MRRIMGLSVLLVVMFLNRAEAANDAGRFDGAWNTTLTCSIAAGALPYSYQFQSTVKDGVLHGEKGVKGAPGWLELDGTIQPDGKARIHARRLVGSQKAALGQRPVGTPYAYRMEGKFTDKEGTGKRVRSRLCGVTFTKNE